MEKCLKILKKLRDKRVIIMNKNSYIYGACRYKTTFRPFFLSTYDPVKVIFKYYDLKPSMVVFEYWKFS